MLRSGQVNKREVFSHNTSVLTGNDAKPQTVILKSLDLKNHFSLHFLFCSSGPKYYKALSGAPQERRHQHMHLLILVLYIKAAALDFIQLNVFN